MAATLLGFERAWLLLHVAVGWGFGTVSSQSQLSDRVTAMLQLRTLREYAHDLDVDPDGLGEEEMTLLWQRYDDTCWRAIAALGLVPGVPRGVVVEPVDGVDDWRDQCAMALLVSLMGDAWVQERIVDHEACDASKDYLALGSHISQIAVRRFRVRELARRLYEFQSFPWYELVVANLRTGDVGAVAFEMDAMWLLMVASAAVSTRAEVSEKGQDFDCSALMGQVMVPVEVKSKSDITPWTQNTVRNTVKAAAKQLPKGEVGVLFLRVPYAWVGHRLEEEFSVALGEGTRQTTRIGAVVAVIDKPSLSNGDPVSRFLTYFRAPDCPDHIWGACMRLRMYWDGGMTGMAPNAPF